MLENKLTIDTSGPFIRGEKVHRSAQTILQDAGRTEDILFLTVMAQRISDLKWIPVTDVSPYKTGAFLTCGTNGSSLVGWQAVSDGSFQIAIDGIAFDITGLDFTGILALSDIAAIITVALENRAQVFYNIADNSFSFFCTSKGLPESSITVLTAGSAGTDISGPTFLNGLTGFEQGVVTDATGGNGEDIPGGLLLGADVPYASIEAGDVTGINILVGKSVELDEDKIVLENGLELDDVVTATGKTIRQVLADKGIYPKATTYFQNIQPLVE